MMQDGNYESKNSAPPPPCVRTSFIMMLKELLTDLTGVFPECDATKMALSYYETMVIPFVDVQEQFMEEWHKQMSPYYAAIQQRNADALFTAEIPIINKLTLREKWSNPTFDEASRSALWEYFDQLNSYVKVKKGIPTGMMNNMQSLAQELLQKIQNGQLDPQEMSIENISQRVMNTSSPEEMNQFSQALPYMADSITSLSKNNQMGAMIQQMMNGAQPPNNM